MQIKDLMDLERYISSHRAAFGFDPSAVEIEQECFDRIVNEDLLSMSGRRPDERFRYKDVLVIRKNYD